MTTLQYILGNEKEKQMKAKAAEMSLKLEAQQRLIA